MQNYKEEKATARDLISVEQFESGMSISDAVDIVTEVVE